MKKLFTNLFVCCCLILCEGAYAFKCGSNLVSRGDRKIDVLKICGQPDLIEERTELSGVRLRDPTRTLSIENYKPIYIEEWTYNLGPRRLMRLLRFEDGILKKVDTLGYGYRAK